MVGAKSRLAETADAGQTQILTWLCSERERERASKSIAKNLICVFPSRGVDMYEYVSERMRVAQHSGRAT